MILIPFISAGITF